MALLFQYGRYLLQSSSAPGGGAANLQGIWNNSLTPPWSSNYTTNINTQMNYWPAEPTNLRETLAPLFALIQSIAARGAQTARHLYGATRLGTPSHSDIWGTSQPSAAATAILFFRPGRWAVRG